MNNKIIRKIFAVIILATGVLAGACAAPHGNVGVSSHGDGLQLGGSLGVSIGSGGGGGGGGGGPGGGDGGQGGGPGGGGE